MLADYVWAYTIIKVVLSNIVHIIWRMILRRHKRMITNCFKKLKLLCDTKHEKEWITATQTISQTMITLNRKCSAGHASIWTTYKRIVGRWTKGCEAKLLASGNDTAVRHTPCRMLIYTLHALRIIKHTCLQVRAYNLIYATSVTADTKSSSVSSIVPHTLLVLQVTWRKALDCPTSDCLEVSPAHGVGTRWRPGLRLVPEVQSRACH